jgi:amino acid adenylation domain-containing protein/non-ribosomal peptide synthase protein (TIGR01720 family)
LYIGGSGIARGYLNNRELTSERFLPNRFKGDGSRLYRTGDLVRWLADGNLEYLGRNDEQVKIRGYRIELGEIEHALLKLEGIRQASVLCKERKSGSSVSKYLVGYYVSDVEWSPDRITDELSSVLPEYMVPAVYVRLEHFPLTVNGKLDKRKLPEPEFGSGDHVAACTQTERDLSKIWQSVLGVDQVSIRDDFFRIGGDSILSIQVSSRLRQLGYACHVRDIFTHRTIEKLSRHLETSSGESTYKTEQGLLTGSLDLLPVQRWFMEQVDNGRFRTPHHWNQSILIRVGKLDQDRLKAILPKLAWQHDMLRARYRKTISGWEQYYSESIEALTLHQLNVEGLSESAIESVLTGWQSGFDLERGPLFQAGLLEGYRDGSSRIYMAFHHLVVDAVSWRILLEDLRMLYEGKDLGLKASSYRQWVERVKSYGETHASEWSYWLSQVDQLPAASSYGEVEQQEFSDGFELGKKLTDELLHNCSQAYHTEVNDLLLTALAYALKDVSELGVHGVTLEGHGRELIDSQIDHSHTVGWFTTMYPVRLELQRDYAGSIRHIKESLREIPQKGIGFGALRMVHPGEEKVVLPAISFNYLGQFEASQSGEWELSGEGSGLNQGAGNVGENVITINGIVTQGVLRFGITTRLGAAQTIKLSNALRTHLEEIIAHCGKQRPGFTPSDFKGVRISQDLLDKVSEIAHQSGNEIEGIYAANSLQQGFIYHAISEPQDDAYRVQQLYDYEESLDVAAYLKAWESCINQYPILRTGFNWEEDIIQIIYKRGRLEHEFHDLSGLDESSRNASIQQIQQQDRSRGFDLSSPTQMRLHILKHRADYYTVLKSDHHSISDGWSVPILLAHVHQYYSQHRGGERVELKPDTAYQQSQRYIQEHRDEIVAYWEEALSQVEGTNDISSLLSEPIDVNNYREVSSPQSEVLQVSGDRYRLLKELSHREGVTINVIVQFLWHKLLQVYSNSSRTVVGTTVSGRDLPIPGIEDSVGLYINTLPLVIDWSEERTILSQLHHIQDRVSAMSTHSFASLSRLQKDGDRLFHSLFVFENYPVPKGESVIRVSLRQAVEKVDYPLGMLVFEHEGSLVLRLQYDGDCLSSEKAQRHLATLNGIVNDILKDVHQLHSQICLLSPSEYSQIVEQWNRTEKPYRQEATLHELFYEQVARSSESVALVYGDSRLSYGELNQRSNQLARYIRQQYLRKTGEELKADTLIALCLDRSPEMVIGILAVLKAGGAYVPIDPEYPQERIDYMLEDTGAQLVLTHQEIVDRGSVVLPSEKVLLIDLTSALYQSESSSDLDVNGSSSDLAYVIYTSGTTGRPKGVMVEHRSIASLVFNDYIKVDDKDVFAFLSSPVFDASTFEIWTPLLNGNSLVIPEDLRTLLSKVEVFDKFISLNNISVLWLTKTLFESLYSLNDSLFNDLNYLIIGGEALDKVIINDFTRKGTTPRNFLNGYGPTESTTFTCIYNLAHRAESKNVPIGTPINNRTVYVLDSFGQVVPVGVAGELYIGGSGIARGYLNNRELTSERFLPNRFKGDGSRLYRTGDLVRWLADGNLEYLGRNDEQVKIRGYRIELGEIEHALLKLEGIRQASVLCKERKSGSSVSKYLVGYYVSDVEWSPDRITDELSSVLPEYMVPAVYVRLEHFPLTVNGKLDKRKLPEPEFGSGDHVAACTQTERDLSKIWQSVLGVDQVSIRDDFFRIGGDSILSIQVSSRLRQLGYACHVRDIFTHRTIEKLSRHLETSSGESTYKTEQGLLTGSLDLLPVQRWFMEQVDNGRFRTPHHWNQSILIRVGKLDQDRLKAILPKLAWQHDMLRARYRKTISGWEQYYSESIEALTLHQLNVEGLSESAIESVLTGWQSGFDLERGPLFQAGLLEGYRDGSSRIYMAFHHLVVDAVSWRILLEDLRMLYEGKDLGLKASSYRQWVERVKSYGETHASEWSYWLSQVDQLPAASSYGEVEQQEFSDGFELGKKLTDELLHNCSQAYHTEVNDLLLTALAYALKDVSELGVHGVTLEGHGRELIDSQIDHSHTVGWFTHHVSGSTGVAA